MKRGRFILLCCIWLSPLIVHAQNPKGIEADLLIAFKKIAYWAEKKSAPRADDSLRYANGRFSRKLLAITQKYPGTIDQPFGLLVRCGLKITTVSDGMIRIYSWDTGFGGTARVYDNILQYKYGAVTRSINLITAPGDYEPFYWGLYPIKAGKTTYYLGFRTSSLSSAYIVQGVDVFAIRQGKLDLETKLIKTEGGPTNRLDIETDLSSAINRGITEQPRLTFDPKTQTIKVPLVTAQGVITKKFITYKFNGQYFEKVK